MRKYLSLVLLPFLFLSFAPARAQVDLAALDSYISRAVEAYHMPGLAVTIVKDDKVVFAKGYGKRDINKPAPVTENSLFGVASCSKAFTATAVAMLVDEGKIKWDDRVTDYLPDFQLNDPYVTHDMRIRDLLCHRAGFATFDGDLLWYGTTYSRAEVVHRIRELPLKHGFRSTFGYSNVMFITAGELVAKVSGMSWDQFVQTRILTPLAMTSTNTSIHSFISQADRALPHVHGAVFPEVDYDNCGPAASLNSSVNDMAQWLRFWLNKGQVNDQKLLTPASYGQMIAMQTPLNPNRFDRAKGAHFKGYGLGWFLWDYRGKQLVEHDGGLPGYISKISFIPEAKVGVVILCNGMPVLLHEALRNYIFDLYLNGTPGEDYVTDYLRVAAQVEQYEAKDKADHIAAQVKGTSPSLALEKYTGTFRDAFYGDAKISMADGKLYLVMEPSKQLFQGSLNHWHYNSFEVTLRDPYLPPGVVTFELGSKGEVTGFTIDLPNPDFNFPNLHFKAVK